MGSPVTITSTRWRDSPASGPAAETVISTGRRPASSSSLGCGGCRRAGRAAASRRGRRPRGWGSGPTAQRLRRVRQRVRGGERLGDPPQLQRGRHAIRGRERAVPRAPRSTTTTSRRGPSAVGSVAGAARRCRRERRADSAAAPRIPQPGPPAHRAAALADPGQRQLDDRPGAAAVGAGGETPAVIGGDLGDDPQAVTAPGAARAGKGPGGRPSRCAAVGDGHPQTRRALTRALDVNRAVAVFERVGDQVVECAGDGVADRRTAASRWRASAESISRGRARRPGRASARTASAASARASISSGRPRRRRGSPLTARSSSPSASSASPRWSRPRPGRGCGQRGSAPAAVAAAHAGTRLSSSRRRRRRARSETTTVASVSASGQATIELVANASSISRASGASISR